MVLNPGKYCYMSFGSNLDKSDLILEDSAKIPSTHVVLGVTIDNRLTFYNHLKKGSIIAELQNRVTKPATNRVTHYDVANEVTNSKILLFKKFWS